jgi:hypothetical protein
VLGRIDTFSRSIPQQLEKTSIKDKLVDLNQVRKEKKNDPFDDAVARAG